MEALVNKSLADVTSKGKTFQGVCYSEKMFDEFVHGLRAMGFAFSIRRSRTPNVGIGRLTFQEYGEEGFSCVAEITKACNMECVHGVKYFKNNHKDNQSDHPSGLKKRFRLTTTKRLGCPAILAYKVVKMYPAYHVKTACNDWRKKQQVLKEFKADKLSLPVQSVINILVTISKVDHHTHVIGAASKLLLDIDPLLKKQISHCIGNGVLSVHDMKIHLNTFVEDLFKDGIVKPDVTNSAYYPSDKVIYAHMYHECFRQKRSKVDQEALANSIEKWSNKQSNAKIFFRPYKCGEGDVPGTETLLFCYQSDWQQHLLRKYGKMCLLDATYKTTKYSLPLFFLVVKTNVKYMVVGVFVIQTESTKSIAEALLQFSEWNPTWQPSYFMTDYSETEITALETVFPNSVVYLCAFHREQAWIRWVRKKGNITSGDESKILGFWREIANARSEEDFHVALANLHSSSVWLGNAQVRHYFTNTWLSVHKRWVKCFQENPLAMSLSTNNGVESQNKTLKYKYLSFCFDKTLTGMLDVLINDYLPDMLRKYCNGNALLGSHLRKYNSDVPLFLYNRPNNFVMHVLKRYYQAQNDYHSNDVLQLEMCGEFQVKSMSSEGEIWHNVSFSVPSCTCADFKKWQYPCKHFCAIFILYPTWSFDKINPEYVNSPLLNVDINCIGSYIHELPETDTCIQPDNDSEANSIKSCENVIANGNNPSSDNTSPSALAFNQPEPQTAHKLTSTTKQIREMCKELIDLSYNCIDTEKIEHALNSLGSTRDMLLAGTQVEYGLTIDQGSSKTKAQAINGQLSSVGLKSLQIPSKRLNRQYKYQGRVGKSADRHRNALQTVDVNLQTNTFQNMSAIDFQCDISEQSQNILVNEAKGAFQSEKDLRRKITKRRKACGICAACKIAESCGTCRTCLKPSMKKVCLQRQCKNLS